MTALGARLVAISPQLPDGSLSTAEANELTFDVLSDVGNRVARSFGLVCLCPNSCARRCGRTTKRCRESTATTVGAAGAGHVCRRPRRLRRSRRVDVDYAIAWSLTPSSQRCGRCARRDPAGHASTRNIRSKPPPSQVATTLSQGHTMIRFYFHPTPNPRRLPSSLKRPAFPTRSSQSTPARASSTRPRSGRSTRTARYRRSSIRTGPVARRRGCSIPPQSCFTLLKDRPAPRQARGPSRAALMLLFIASGLGPFSGQAVHFQFAAPEGLNTR